MLERRAAIADAPGEHAAVVALLTDFPASERHATARAIALSVAETFSRTDRSDLARSTLRAVAASRTLGA